MTPEQKNDTLHRYWLNADRETVKKYLSENTKMSEYEKKKEKILSDINKYHRPPSINNCTFILVMAVMLLIGIIATYFNL